MDVAGGDLGKRGKKSGRIRLADIAKSCGVSLSTASRALSGEKGVRERTRQQILDTARKINYAIPKSVEGKRVLLFLSKAAMTDISRNQSAACILNGINARARNLNVTPVSVAAGDITGRSAIVRMVDGDPSVIGVLALTLDDETVIDAMRGLEKPGVLVNTEDPRMLLSSVMPSNRFMAELATEYLIGLGHERILLLTRPGRLTIERRLAGWRNELARHNLPAGDDMVMEVGDWLPELASEMVMRRIKKRGLDFTAILATGDALAIGAMLGVRQMGLSIPGDLSVMGMDDLPQSAFMTPPMTVMHIPMHEMGKLAMNILYDNLSPYTTPPLRVEVTSRLIERASTGPARRDCAVGRAPDFL